MSLSCSLLLYAPLLQLFSQPKRLILVKCDAVTHQSPPFPLRGRESNWDIVSAAQLYLGSHKPSHTAVSCKFSVKNKIYLVSPGCCYVAKSLSFTQKWFSMENMMPQLSWRTSFQFVLFIMGTWQSKYLE